MTSSETSTDRPRRSKASARTVAALVVGGVALLSGWGFVLWHHSFRVTAPVVVLMLGWLAVLSMLYFFWRTADNADLDDREDWWRAAGRIEELNREKRSLLKAIKETEQDREMGKLSAQDAAELIARYRGQAIEVIKSLEEATGAALAADDVKAQIEREVRARAQVDRAGKAGKKAKDKKDKKAKAKSTAPAKATEAETETASEAETESASEAETESETETATATETETETETATEAETAPEKEATA